MTYYKIIVKMRMQKIADSPKINVKLHNNKKNYIDI